jgi:hypothetical protein
MSTVKTRRRCPKVVIEKVYFDDINTLSKSRMYYVATRYEQGKPVVYSVMTNKIGK